MGTVREEEHAERELALESIDLSPLLLQAPDGLLQLRHSAVGALDNGRRLLDEAADGSRGAEPQFQTDPRHRRSRLRPTLSFPHSLPLCRLAANENIVQRKRGGRPFYTAQHRRGEERRRKRRVVRFTGEGGRKQTGQVSDPNRRVRVRARFMGANRNRFTESRCRFFTWRSDSPSWILSYFNSLIHYNLLVIFLFAYLFKEKFWFRNRRNRLFVLIIFMWVF